MASASARDIVAEAIAEHTRAAREGLASGEWSIEMFSAEGCADAVLAALTAARLIPGKDEVIVPREATEEMLYAMGQAADFHIPIGANRAVVWSAMIASVPGAEDA